MNLIQDFRLSLRRLRKAPLFATVAILSIGLGIGANTAVFSLLDQILLRALPVREPERLVLFRDAGIRAGSINTNYDDTVSYTYPNYRDFLESHIFDGVLARGPINLAVTWHGQTDRVTGEIVSADYFQVLGSQAAIGRTLLPEDNRTPGAHPVAVLDYGYWKSRFGGNPNVLNQTLLLNEHPMTIVGVMPPAFHGVGTAERPYIYVPMMMRGEMTGAKSDLDSRTTYWLNIFARLKPGMTAAQAEAAVNTLWHPILEQESKAFPNWSAKTRQRFTSRHVQLLPGAQGIAPSADDFASGMGILAGMVGLLLLIACANVASLMIARGMARHKEIAIYLALGANRFSLFRQMMVESLLISLAGGALGVLMAYWAGDGILSLIPANDYTMNLTAKPDARVLLFTFAASILSGFLFGIAPALQSSRFQISTMLKEQAASVMGGRGQIRLRKGLVIAQVALSLVLLICAGLFTYGLRNLKNVPTGFRTDHLISFNVQPRLNGYGDEKRSALYGQLSDNLATIPGVEGVGAANVMLLAGDNSGSGIDIPGYTFREGEPSSPSENWVNPGYFRMIGIPLIEGREFTAQDRATAPRVAVVNESFARRFFMGNALGRRFRMNKVDIEIVGVVRDSKYSNIREKAEAFMFFPYMQAVPNGMTFYLRTTRELTSIVPEIRRQVGSIDPNLPIFEVKTMSRQIDESLFTEELVSILSAAFGGLATLLAAVGLYGVMAYLVVRRTREIGIRMALGATPRQVLDLVMREVVLLAGLGVIAALVAWFPLGGVIQGEMGDQLFHITGWNPLVVTAATMALSLVALLAGFLPARRATRIEPTAALRYE